MSASPGSTYEIVVEGELVAAMAHAFEGMRLEKRGGNTAIVGHVSDQAQLDATLERVTDLGLELVSVEKLPDVGGSSASGRDDAAPDTDDARGAAPLR
jgi:hypothetical protein